MKPLNLSESMLYKCLIRRSICSRKNARRTECFSNVEVIGINISPVIIKNEKDVGATYANYKALIRYILDNTDASIALIPHVVWKSNDDRIPLKQLYDDFNQNPRLFLVGDHTAPG